MEQSLNTIRYYLNSSSTCFMKLNNETLSLSASFKVESNINKPVFLDILEKTTTLIWKIKLYYPTGAVIKECYICPVTLDLISIYNFQHLLDGRFNS